MLNILVSLCFVIFSLTTSSFVLFQFLVEKLFLFWLFFVEIMKHVVKDKIIAVFVFSLEFINQLINLINNTVCMIQ